MGVFSTNQNRQMYVALSNGYQGENVDTVGDVVVKGVEYKYFYLSYVDTEKKIRRSDIVPLDKIVYAKATPADNLKLKLKSVKVTLADEELVTGEDYILRINIRQAFGPGDDSIYQKFGAVRAKANMTVAEFWKAMKESLERNFSKELTEWFTFTADATSLTITEVEQPWIPGKLSKVNVLFDIVNCTIISNGVETEAFEIATPTYTAEEHNGHTIVDQEIFYLGERGDQYRDVCGIYKINTQYLAKPDKDYCALDIHYSFVDSNEGAQKSEKDLYIVGEKAILTQIKTMIERMGATFEGTL